MSVEKPTTTIISWKTRTKESNLKYFVLWYSFFMEWIATSVHISKWVQVTGNRNNTSSNGSSSSWKCHGNTAWNLTLHHWSCHFITNRRRLITAIELSLLCLDKWMKVWVYGTYICCTCCCSFLFFFCYTFSSVYFVGLKFILNCCILVSSLDRIEGKSWNSCFICLSIALLFLVLFRLILKIFTHAHREKHFQCYKIIEYSSIKCFLTIYSQTRL